MEHPFDQKHFSGTGYLPGGVGFYKFARNTRDFIREMNRQDVRNKPNGTLVL
ncbi:MAG TPA: hypothetical protein VFD57_01045 [Clostridia bacterium]|nr:hypothetical protein [Clostridia bacterium]